MDALGAAGKERERTLLGWVRSLSIRLKLKAIILAASGTVMVLSCAVFFTYDLLSAKAAARQRLETLAQVVANQSTASLSFGDAKSASEILGALSAEGDIESAAAYSKDGNRVASYARTPDLVAAIPSRAPEAGLIVADDGYGATVPVYSETDRVGSVYLRSSLRGLTRRMGLNLAVVLAIILGATFASLILASRLGATLTGPILRLSETAWTVSKEKAYSVRAEKSGEDELGVLTDAFNEMLGEIQFRDLELQKHRGELEKRVEERTAALTREIARREQIEAFLRDSEEQYRNLVELSPDAILLHTEGSIVFANTAAAHLLSASSTDDLIGRGILEFAHPESRAGLSEELRRVTAERKESALQEFRLVRLDGRAFDVETASCPSKYAGAPAIQMVFRDVTKRKELDRLKNEFISTVSHELRTPLTSIRGSLGLLGGGALGPVAPAAKRLITIADENSQRLVRLINDILDIEKIAAGKMEFVIQPVDAIKVVEQSIEATRAYAAQLGVVLCLSSRPGEGRILADPDRLGQVLANLLSNASKFSPKGGRVEISIVRHGESLRISVADHGPGIPEEFRSRIFQKFAQADSSDTRQKGGTGLGLSITKALVERMGGRISFDTVPGRGTTFHVEFPECTSAAVGIRASRESA